MRVHSLDSMHVTGLGWSLKPAHRAVALLGRALTLLCPPDPNLEWASLGVEEWPCLGFCGVMCGVFFLLAVCCTVGSQPTSYLAHILSGCWHSGHLVSAWDMLALVCSYLLLQSLSGPRRSLFLEGCKSSANTQSGCVYFWCDGLFLSRSMFVLGQGGMEPLTLPRIFHPCQGFQNEHIGDKVQLYHRVFKTQWKIEALGGKGSFAHTSVWIFVSSDKGWYRKGQGEEVSFHQAQSSVGGSRATGQARGILLCGCWGCSISGLSEWRAAHWPLAHGVVVVL